MIAFFRGRVRSFRWAIAGIFYLVRTQRNAWVHLAASVGVVGAGGLGGIGAVGVVLGGGSDCGGLGGGGV